jgi:hypothetical protein
MKWLVRKHGQVLCASVKNDARDCPTATRVCENQIRWPQHDAVKSMQGLKPSIYKAFSARLKVVPCYMSRRRTQTLVLTHPLKPKMYALLRHE